MVANCSKADYQLPIGKEVLSIDPRYFRPTEVDLLIGDPTKSKEKLGWKPSYTLETLVQEMVRSDIEIAQRDQYLKQGGHKTFSYHE